jgi:uncharacterized membrane protein YkoI
MTVSCLAAAVLMTGLACGTYAGESKKVALSDVPESAQAAIKKFAGENAISKIKQKSEDGKVVYEAKLKVNDLKQEIEVLADGTVITTEKEIRLTQTPDAVQKAINQAATGGTVKEVVEENEGGKVSYEAEIVVNGTKKEIKFSADGKILESEDKDKEKESK